MKNRSIIHVDMDAFYASIEQRDNIFLRNKPIVVGGNPDSRGVVCTASYEARKYGVRSAMSCQRAKVLCPNLIFVPVDKVKYRKVSRKIQSILKLYSEKIEPISLDEAFIDCTGKDAKKIGRMIKKNIYDRLNLTASVGISYNKFLAKLASDMEKPNGFTIINKENALSILAPMSIRKLWGVGPKTEQQLHRLGIYKISDMQNYDEKILIEKFGKKGTELLQFARGNDDRPVRWNNRIQSIGEENTFSKDIDDITILKNELNKFIIDIFKKIKENRYKIKTITIKIKYEDFSIRTKSTTFKLPTDNLDIIKRTSYNLLLEKFNINKKVRLLGLTVSNLVYPDEPTQLKIDIDKYF